MGSKWRLSRSSYIVALHICITLTSLDFGVKCLTVTGAGKEPLYKKEEAVEIEKRRERMERVREGKERKEGLRLSLMVLSHSSDLEDRRKKMRRVHQIVCLCST